MEDHQYVMNDNILACGPQIGQPRGYAFVTYDSVKSANIALTKLHGKHIGTKMVVVRLAKNLSYDDIEKPKQKISIPVLEAGSSSNEPLKVSKEITIQAIEAKLKMLESKADDFEINKTASDEVPLIHKYQFNKNNVGDLKSSTKQSTKYNTKTRYNNLHHKRHKR
ncbi:hypothetical protein HA402_007337 [Bradysia odoriphaga]|nr:hypothetical protein HA402_007337 [Bradysia odoriphaga]